MYTSYFASEVNRALSYYDASKLKNKTTTKKMFERNSSLSAWASYAEPF